MPRTYSEILQAITGNGFLPDEEKRGQNPHILTFPTIPWEPALKYTTLKPAPEAETPTPNLSTADRSI
jgi:hypothetical protein